jgi:hypothetical protein
MWTTSAILHQNADVAGRQHGQVLECRRNGSSRSSYSERVWTTAAAQFMQRIPFDFGKL